MIDNKVTLVYEGEINQTITKAFSALTEKNMNEEQESSTTVKRVYHVMVECLQNICKHSDEVDPVLGELSGNGIFLVGHSEEAYTIITGNNVNNDKIEGLTTMLNKLNKMEPEEVKAFYKQIIKETTLSNRGGAGLGFIDIVKKTGNRIDFHFEPIDEHTSFFILVSRINKVG
jgi:coenzyme F420-reducing hydrogenase delta subunit